MGLRTPGKNEQTCFQKHSKRSCFFKVSQVCLGSIISRSKIVSVVYQKDIYFASGNNVSRMAKLGNIGETMRATNVSENMFACFARAYHFRR